MREFSRQLGGAASIVAKVYVTFLAQCIPLHTKLENVWRCPLTDVDAVKGSTYRDMPPRKVKPGCRSVSKHLKAQYCLRKSPNMRVCVPLHPPEGPDASDPCAQKDGGTKKIKLGQDISQYFDRRKVLPAETCAPVPFTFANLPSFCVTGSSTDPGSSPKCQASPRCACLVLLDVCRKMDYTLTCPVTQSVCSQPRLHHPVHLQCHAGKQAAGSAAPQPQVPGSQPLPAARARAPSGRGPPGQATAIPLLSTTARKHVLQQGPQAPGPKAPTAIDLANDSGPDRAAAAPPPRPPASAGAGGLATPITAQAQAPQSITGSQPRVGHPLPPLKPGRVAEAGAQQPPDSVAGAGPDGRPAGAAKPVHSARKRPRRPASSMHSQTSTAQVLPSSKLWLL